MNRKTFETWMREKHPGVSLQRVDKRYVDKTARQMVSAWKTGWAHSEARAVPAVSALDDMVRAFYSALLMGSPEERKSLLAHFMDTPSKAQAELMKLFTKT